MKEQNERAIGDKFVDFYNSNHEMNFRYKGRPVEAPDLTYADGTDELNIEVGTAYYDRADAKARWSVARALPHAQRGWAGINFEDQMIENIGAIIAEKCGKDYGLRCVLVVHVRPMLTTVEDMWVRLNDIKLPARIPFDGIYLSGDFADNYSCWQLHAPQQANPRRRREPGDGGHPLGTRAAGDDGDLYQAQRAGPGAGGL